MIYLDSAAVVATALSIGSQLTSFVTYDKRLTDAATAAGLMVDMPTSGGGRRRDGART
jgi:hypothetical protein